MSTHPVSPSDSPRAEARRDQIRAAAADCFRRHGFHGTSIAQISKAAGMSPGHIYHYFENKEAIIADIVAQDLDHVLTLIAELRSARDVREAMIERVVEAVAEHLDADTAALRLEISAEAARNPRIAAIVRDADERIRAGLADTLHGLRQAAGHADRAAAISAMVEAIIALFEGLQIRSVRNPGLDRGQVTQMYQQILRGLLAQAAESAG
ncbi:MAG: TetR/AcrR family transcriptional regulator [Gammaproteobacteria bacterium]